MCFTMHYYNPAMGYILREPVKRDTNVYLFRRELLVMGGGGLISKESWSCPRLTDTRANQSWSLACRSFQRSGVPLISAGGKSNLQKSGHHLGVVVARRRQQISSWSYCWGWEWDIPSPMESSTPLVKAGLQWPNCKYNHTCDAQF